MTDNLNDNSNYLDSTKNNSTSLFAKEVLPIALEKEMQTSYLSYAMSVIVGRALPDVRDGLKPVHRRILYSMYEMGNSYNKPYKKSARIVGDVIGKYHPHGDTAIYDSLVRMAQKFTLRYTLINGQGNFGSIDGDAPAAMRYTEVRMERITFELMQDLDKETVEFIPNYDESESEPSVLPTKVPNLLINGSEGIAVGMATKIPPHNLRETIEACIALIDNPEISIDDLCQYVKAPDFPTGAIISNISGVKEAYKTGRGKVLLTSKVAIQDNNKGGQQLVVTEIPYLVQKSSLLEKISILVRNKRLTGISSLRDESDKDGLRVVIEIKKNELADVVLNNLFKETDLQKAYNLNLVAIDKGRPALLNLKNILQAFVNHREEVVTSRVIYDLRKAREKTHLLEGLTIALNNIDKMIAIIKAASNTQDAKVKLLAEEWLLGSFLTLFNKISIADVRVEELLDKYGVVGDYYKLSPEQAQAILEMRLNKLTGLEQEKIFSDYKNLVANIEYFLSLLRNREKLTEVIKQELIEINENYGDERKSIIDNSIGDVEDEDLIPREDKIVTLSRDGYIKSQSLDEYRTQHRGGRGKASAKKAEDVIERLMIVNSHNILLCFSNLGKVYWMKTYNIPNDSRESKGRPIVKLLNLEAEEYITSILAVAEFRDDEYLFFATQKGKVKKVLLNKFARKRSNGLIALNLNDNDRLVATAITNGENEIMLFAKNGKAIRFKETNVRTMGRSASGVRGMNLGKGDKIVNMQLVDDTKFVFSATKNGYGKLTPVKEYRTIKRGGKGMISINTSLRNGELIDSHIVEKKQDAILITNYGTTARIGLSEVPQSGRNTQGAKLINIKKENEQLVSMAIVSETEMIADELKADEEVMISS